MHIRCGSTFSISAKTPISVASLVLSICVAYENKSTVKKRRRSRNIRLKWFPSLSFRDRWWSYFIYMSPSCCRHCQRAFVVSENSHHFTECICILQWVVRTHGYTWNYVRMNGLCCMRVNVCVCVCCRQQQQRRRMKEILTHQSSTNALCVRHCYGTNDVQAPDVFFLLAFDVVHAVRLMHWRWRIFFGCSIYPIFVNLLFRLS